MKSQIPRPLNQTLPIGAQDILITAATGDIKGNITRAKKIDRAVAKVMADHPKHYHPQPIVELPA